ncbi:hypothetical protein LCGC14_0823260 [marine sediment metagenome]|uniref:Uncharacterized protein n=1 Tax=marine sediment metagenome TaxID=412755 RepID=A0A0F9Q3D1_9ZZZZ|nr:hypothetical protein [Candidatus Scalindua sp.]
MGNQTDKQKELQNVEPLEATKAFELYYALGEGRSQSTVVKQIKASTKKVYGWYSRHFWEERILARDFQQAKVIQMNSSRDVEEMKLKFGEAIRNSITNLFVSKTNKDTGEIQLEFSIKPKTIYELDGAVKLWLLLMGESTDIHTVKVEVVETVINQVIQVIQLHVKDPKLLADIAVDLQKGKTLVWNNRNTQNGVYNIK